MLNNIVYVTNNKEPWTLNTNISNLILLTDVFAIDLWWSVKPY